MCAAVVKASNHFLGAAVGHNHFELHLGQQVDVVLLAAIDLLVALLPAMAADVGDGHAIDADGFERLFYLFELERLN